MGVPSLPAGAKSPLLGCTYSSQDKVRILSSAASYQTHLGTERESEESVEKNAWKGLKDSNRLTSLKVTVDVDLMCASMVMWSSGSGSDASSCSSNGHLPPELRMTTSCTDVVNGFMGSNDTWYCTGSDASDIVV